MDQVKTVGNKKMVAGVSVASIIILLVIILIIYLLWRRSRKVEVDVDILVRTDADRRNRVVYRND